MKKRIKQILSNPNYFASELGEIYSAFDTLKTPLKPYKDKNGYLRYSLQGKQYAGHRLVIEAFIGKHPYAVNHKDGNKENNSIDNLEYCTNNYNTKHAWETGLCGILFLDEETVTLIKKHIELGDLSLQEIASIFDIPFSYIYRISKGYNPHDPDRNNPGYVGL